MDGWNRCGSKQACSALRQTGLGLVNAYRCVQRLLPINRSLSEIYDGPLSSLTGFLSFTEDLEDALLNLENWNQLEIERQEAVLDQLAFTNVNDHQDRRLRVDEIIEYWDKIVAQV